MGKIFGISNNPVSTIDSALRPVKLNPPPAVDIYNYKKPLKVEKIVNRAQEPNYFIKMRNGIGKLMSHFSKVDKTAKK